MGDGTAGEENDTGRDANSGQPGTAFQRATSFAQIDFVDFVRQRDGLGRVNLIKLMAVPVFYDAATDFWNGLVSQGAASSRIWHAITSVESETVMQGAAHGFVSVLASRAVALAGYCSMLPEGDPRRVALEPRRLSDDILRKYVDPATGARYSIRSEDDLSYRTSAETRDRREYVIYWSRAFPDSFDRLIEDRRLLSRIYSASCHGADYVGDILGLAATELPDDLPCIDARMRIELVTFIASLQSCGLLRYHFEPEDEFPGYFSELPVRSMDSPE